MRFNPAPEEKLKRTTSFEPFPAGEYEYTVDFAESRISNAGNEMIALTLVVYDAAGHKRNVFDYLVANAAWKIKQFAESCGLLDKFNAGEIEEFEMIGKTGRCKLRVESSEQYGDQNKVAFYIADKKPSSVRRPTNARTKSPAGDIDDDIPF